MTVLSLALPYRRLGLPQQGAGYGKFQAKDRGTAQREEGCKRRKEQADSCTLTEEDPHCLGEGRRESCEAQAAQAPMTGVHFKPAPVHPAHC
jgi:hypothetical protein